MAHPSSLVLALLLVTTSISLSLATPDKTTTGLVDGLLGTQVAQLSVLGRLACTATGNVLDGVTSPGISGVNVLVKCNGGTLDLGSLTTNATGFFDGVLKVADGLLFDPSTCVAQVKLPIASCTLLPPTGILQAALSVGSIIDTLLGLVASLLTGTWEVLV